MDHPDTRALQTDITEQEYRGPSRFITTLGQGVIDHLKFALGGIALVFPLAFLASTHAEQCLTSWRSAFQTLKELPIPHDAGLSSRVASRFKRGAGSLLHMIVGEGKGAIQVSAIDPEHQPWLDYAVMSKERGFAHWFISHTVGFVPGYGKRIISAIDADHRLANAFTVAGVAGAAGYSGGWVKAFFMGGERAHTGKRQFMHAQEEIRDQRAINEALRNKYAEVKVELDGTKTAQAIEAGTLHVTKDEPAAKLVPEMPTDVPPPPGEVHVPMPIHRDETRLASDALQQAERAATLSVTPESDTPSTHAHSAVWHDKVATQAERAHARQAEIA